MTSFNKERVCVAANEACKLLRRHTGGDTIASAVPELVELYEALGAAGSDPDLFQPELRKGRAVWVKNRGSIPLDVALLIQAVEVHYDSAVMMSIRSEEYRERWSSVIAAIEPRRQEPDRSGSKIEAALGGIIWAVELMIQPTYRYP